jgi:hypothetical protein
MAAGGASLAGNRASPAGGLFSIVRINASRSEPGSELMSSDRPPSVLRLRKRHEPKLRDPPTAAEGARLVQAQSLSFGLLAGLLALALFTAFWVLVTDVANRFLPWMPVLLGIFVGLAVRRGGQGFYGRFPLLAAVLTLLGALAGIIVISAGTTAAELDSSTWAVLWNVTAWTWPVFFDEVLTAADMIFAGTGALLAAFFSFRRLTRREFQAVRRYEEETRSTHDL